MKRFSFTLVLLALALVVGLAFAGCKSEPDGDPLNGTWQGTFAGNEVDCLLANGGFTMKMDGADAVKGRYTKDGDTITFTVTHADLSKVAYGFTDLPTGLKTTSEINTWLLGQGMTQSQIDANFPEIFTPITATVVGDTITIPGQGTLTRQ